MSRKNRDELPHRWGELRFSVVGGLLSSPPKPGELQERLEELSKKRWIHPVTEEEVRFSFSTIEHWYYRAKLADNPIEALTTAARIDRGSQKALRPELMTELKRQYKLHPGWSVKLHHENLAVVAKRDTENFGEMPSYSTLCRQMKALGLRKKKRPRNPTPGQRKAYERREKRETRSYEKTHVGALGHLDFHQARRCVVGKDGEWIQPVCFAAMDDYSRLCLHAQWYLVENTSNLVHGFEQVIMKRGLFREFMTDNGGAMKSEEFRNGLGGFSITHRKTLPYSPHQNAKQENFWATLEGQLMSMLENVEDLTIAQLNEYTQAWVEQGYNHHYHEEIECTPVERFQKGPFALRDSPDQKALQLAFCARVNRKQRHSDGTITLDGVRFEIPNHLRTLDNVTVRYRSWDLSFATVVDKRTGAELARILPLNKTQNASAKRRELTDEPAANFPKDIKDEERVAPLLQKMLEDYSATGLPPAYVPKDESNQSETNNKEINDKNRYNGGQTCHTINYKRNTD